MTPSLSILAEPPVAIVEKNAAKKGNLNLAKGYLNYGGVSKSMLVNSVNREIENK